MDFFGKFIESFKIKNRFEEMDQNELKIQRAKELKCEKTAREFINILADTKVKLKWRNVSTITQWLSEHYLKKEKLEEALKFRIAFFLADLEPKDSSFDGFKNLDLDLGCEYFDEIFSLSCIYLKKTGFIDYSFWPKSFLTMLENPPSPYKEYNNYSFLKSNSFFEMLDEALEKFKKDNSYLRTPILEVGAFSEVLKLISIIRNEVDIKKKEIVLDPPVFFKCKELKRSIYHELKGDNEYGGYHFNGIICQSDMHSLEIASLRSNGDLTNLESAVNLVNFTLNCVVLENFTVFSQMKKLRRLQIIAKIKSFKDIEFLDNINELRLIGSKILDLSPLAKLKNLKKLTLEEGHNIEDEAQKFLLKELPNCQISFKECPNRF